MTVDCDFKKWGDVQHYRFDAEHLGRDEHGVWLACRAPVAITAGPQGAFDIVHDFVILVPNASWWIASFNGEPSDIEVYVDITTPSTWPSGSHVTSVDLDLDVIRFRDGRVVIVDEDEFDEHTVAYGYPDDVVRTARGTAAEMLDAVTTHREPFGEAGARWLEKL